MGQGTELRGKCTTASGCGIYERLIRHGEHGDVPFLAGRPVDRLSGGAYGAAVSWLDLLGEGGRVAVPAPHLADRERARARPCTAQPSGEQAAPVSWAVTRRRAASGTRRAPRANCCDRVPPSLRRSPRRRRRPRCAAGPLGERVSRDRAKVTPRVTPLGVVDRGRCSCAPPRWELQAGPGCPPRRRASGHCRHRSSAPTRSAGKGPEGGPAQVQPGGPARQHPARRSPRAALPGSASGRNARRHARAPSATRLGTCGVKLQVAGISVMAGSTAGSRSPSLIFGALTRTRRLLVGAVAAISSAWRVAV